MKKIRLNISGMHCVSCSMLIEGELEDLGVRSCQCNYTKQYVDVEYDEKKMNEEQIIKTIQRLNYSIIK